MSLDIQAWKRIFIHIAERIEENKDQLSELDRAVGDGDHGVTMSIGWQAIVNKINEYDGEDCGALCTELAMAFLNAVGSSVGPLYATAFMRGAVVLKGKHSLEEEDVVQFWLAAIGGIQERGKAKVGDKTMMDAWLPAMDALQRSRGQGRALDDSLQAAVEAGKAGMESTADLVSRIGRSSRLGERSTGHIDPGAASAHLILSAFTQALKAQN